MSNCFFKKLELELDKKRVEYIKDYRDVGICQSTYRIVRRKKKKNTGIMQMSAVMSNVFLQLAMMSLRIARVLKQQQQHSDLSKELMTIKVQLLALVKRLDYVENKLMMRK